MKNDTEKFLAAFKRLIDYECNNLLYWMGQCVEGSPIWHIYQAQFNQLVFMRQKLSIEFVLQFLDGKKFDMPEALLPVYEKQTTKPK